MPIRETLKQAGYKYIDRSALTGIIRLLNTKTNKVEYWFPNKHHAGYGLIWKNTHLEYASTEGK